MPVARRVASRYSSVFGPHDVVSASLTPRRPEHGGRERRHPGYPGDDRDTRCGRFGTVAGVTDDDVAAPGAGSAEQFIRVVLVDAADGAELVRSDVPAADLPDSFDADTTLTLGDAQWSVERAEPPTAAGFRETGTLTLALRRVELVDPRDLLFSLPTICDVVPSAEQLDVLSEDEWHEDDWRQIEFVAAGLADVVETEFDAIRVIYQEHAEYSDDGALIGFQQVHVRDQPAVPIPSPVSKQRLLSLLPAGPDTDGAGMFARTAGPVLLYGVADDDDVSVLGVHFDGAPGPEIGDPLREVMRSFHLVLVDWYRYVLVGADDLDGYLSEESDI